MNIWVVDDDRLKSIVRCQKIIRGDYCTVSYLHGNHGFTVLHTIAVYFKQ